VVPADQTLAAASGTVTACAWCGRELDSRARRRAGRVDCAACGVATTDPVPTDAELDAAYSGWYRPDAGRFSGVGDRVLRRLRGSLARRIDRTAPAGPVLDVGAGDGVLVTALRNRGRSATGLERGASSHPHVEDRDIESVEGTWAAIVFWHSLEHLRRPGPALDAAVERLAPGGLLVVAVPDARSLQARLFGDRWLGLDLPRHLVHCTRPALVTALTTRGLRVERLSGTRGGQVFFGWLHGLIASLPGHVDLYDAIRRPAARRAAMTPVARIAALAGAVALSPVALLGAAVEVAGRRAGSAYVEARRVR
jgi:SAM-dependent methyltransferase